jgi:hypothetical protein
MKFWGAAALAITLIAVPASATTTFAQYEQVDDGPQTIAFGGGSLTDTGGLLGSVVLFNFLNVMPVSLDGQVEAYLTVDAGGSPFDGTVSFHRVTDMANLLTLHFTNATLVGAGGSGALFGTQPGGGTVTYTSDFLDFSGQTAGDFSIGLSGITPGFSAAAWTADSVGTFASDSANGGNGVPEPATWTMMIIGFGGVGALMRRRRTLAFSV